MLISRVEDREVAKSSLGKEEGGLIFGNRHNVVAGGLGVLVEAAQVFFYFHFLCVSIKIFTLSQYHVDSDEAFVIAGCIRVFIHSPDEASRSE